MNAQKNKCAFLAGIAPGAETLCIICFLSVSMISDNSNRDWNLLLLGRSKCNMSRKKSSLVLMSPEILSVPEVLFSPQTHLHSYIYNWKSSALLQNQGFGLVSQDSHLSLVKSGYKTTFTSVTCIN